VHVLSDSAILRKIRQQPRQTAGYKQLVRELGLHGDDRNQLSAKLERMVSAGDLIAIDSSRYAIPQPAAGKNLISGKLSLHRDGFGFVIPDLKSASAGIKSRIAGDIFVPPHAMAIRCSSKSQPCVTTAAPKAESFAPCTAPIPA
jgi:ribonuclease R